MERLTFAFDEYKSATLDTSTGEFSGHAAVFGNVDIAGDRIVPGAFAKSIVKHGGKLPVFWGHPDPVFGTGDPIGISKGLSEDHKGLFLNTNISTDNARGREAHIWLKFAKSNDYKPGLSIGFQTKDWEMDRDIRILKEIELYEASIVNFPANPRARIEEVKSIRYFEQVLRDAGLSKAEAKQFLADAKEESPEAHRDASGLEQRTRGAQLALLLLRESLHL
jgi:HK97 family phage prohead protease